MELQRTMRIRLKPNAATSALLERTVAAYTASFNAVARYGFDAGITNGVELHKATYYDQRESTGLPAQLTCSARMKATEAIKGIKARIKKGKKASCPQSIRSAIRYDARSYSVWFDRNEASLLTTEGRVRLPFKIPAIYQEYITWKTGSTDLIKDKKGRFWLHIVVSKIIEDTPATGDVVGIDLGIVTPAMDSCGNSYGSPRWKVVEDRFYQLRRRLQAKGSKSAKRHLRVLFGRQARFRRDCDHVLSKRIVRSVNPGTVLAFEDLTDIRARVKLRKAQRRRLHGWSFAQLQAFTAYKAQARGVHVAYVDARYTSQRCSTCGHTEKANRPSQAKFECLSCGFLCHADLNAAYNIRDNYLISQGRPVNRPIVSDLASA